jgi:hypothetical protein
VTGIAPAAIMKVVFEDIRAARGSAAHLEGVGSLDNWSVDFVAAMVEGAVGTGTRRAFRRRTGRAASAPARLAREPLDACYRRCESAQRWRTQRSRRGQPSTSVAESGWMTSPVKAGLRPPPPAADGLDRACHPAFVGHQAFDGKEGLKSKQRPCRLFSLRHLCADSDSHPQTHLLSGAPAVQSSSAAGLAADMSLHLSTSLNSRR